MNTGGWRKFLVLKTQMAFQRRDATPLGERCNGFAEVLPRFCGRDATEASFLQKKIHIKYNNIGVKRERCNGPPRPICKGLFWPGFLQVFVRNAEHKRERCNGRRPITA
jgi:hypothetical protein